MKDDINEIEKMALNQMIERGEIPQTIFKYRPDNDNTEKIIRDKTLWFSSPRDFNDPFDCWVNCAAPDMDFVQSIISNSWLPNLTKSFCRNGVSLFNKNMLKQCVDNTLAQIKVCCFSKVCDNILMWSHYADSHKGVCFQFDILESPICFSMVKNVQYLNCMPLYDDSKDRPKIIEKVIQPKAKAWSYEEEVRVVKTPDMLKRETNRIPFNPSALKKIIFGCKVTPKTIEKYRRLLCNVDEFKHVKFSQMQQSDNGIFGLIEKEIQK